MINDIKTEKKNFNWRNKITNKTWGLIMWKLRLREIGVYWKEWNKSEFNWEKQNKGSKTI